LKNRPVEHDVLVEGRKKHCIFQTKHDPQVKKQIEKIESINLHKLWEHTLFD